MPWKTPWIALLLVFVCSFGVLLYAGHRISVEAPPIPTRVLSSTGELLIDEGEVMAGQSVWQAMGGMEVGSIWGHGSYVAPDWTADYLHRESVMILDRFAQAEGASSYAEAPAELQAALRARLQGSGRSNQVEAGSGDLIISAERAAAFHELEAYYAELFTKGRSDYAIPSGAQSDPDKLHTLTSFFFWTAWAASTDRPSTPGVSYTNNWPHEPLVENRVTGDALLWTGVSIIVLLAGITGLVWWRVSGPPGPTISEPPANDPLLGTKLTPSQRVTLVYFGVVSALFLVQIAMGVITAHFGVEGDGFYGVPLSRWLPYVITRTWHTQLGIFWIATAWLAAGLFIAPSIGDGDPPFQRAGVIVLLGALVLVVVGSMVGQWLSVMHKFSNDTMRFYFGHSGYEYIDLARVFQIGLLVGLFLWIVLVTRAVKPALMRKDDDSRGLLVLFVLSALAIAGFYGAALGYGQNTHLSIAEYWRWWVVHLWVEGFFEVFATVVFAFLFARLGLLEPKSTERAVVAAAAIFLAGGIIGTLHHLYYSGTPAMVAAWGSVFSALEVVPLVLIGHEAWDHLRLSRAQSWVKKYRYPIYFFLAVAFWNAIGAGLFGFMINPPIALYFMQGLNTTPVHGHAALFGVYGMLGLALTLFCARAADAKREWNERPLAISFWLLNIGLFAMVVISLLPVGLLQTQASVEVGYWYARSAEFMQTPTMTTLRWLRVIGDTLFGVGALAFVYFMTTLLRRAPARG
ncbi:Nitric oxide reductase subunit B [Enhygromyxa salina]|uniref:Nitric oxide reductase subunit B n=1 Tax=Enhygromyxa salina TaxID=215803 RepID=A0A2S9XE03_9BACT|nr:nitric-oxide reductase large subunit [Enhygromyxa salina]PRP91096.1 Nitric oxide reductase subunit B [Enhygromyxa salina]